MASSIPITCRDNAGTGFLLTDGKYVWLITCVHLISGLIETPNSKIIFIDAAIRIAQTSTVIPLFLAGQQRFSVLIHEPTGNLVDALAIKLDPHEVADLVGFDMFEAESIKMAEVGETVTASGFPGPNQQIGSGINTFEPTIVQYQVDEIEGLSIRLSAPSVPGLSGGPVFNQSRLIGIMQGDVGDITAMKFALVISLNVIGEQLLR